MKRILLTLLTSVLLIAACWKSEDELSERVRPDAAEQEGQHTAEHPEPDAIENEPDSGNKETDNTQTEKEPVMNQTVAEDDVRPERLAETSEKTATVVTEGRSEAELWKAYNTAKARLQQAQDDADYETMVASLLDAAACAEALDRPGIAAWQYNNIGYYAIVEFKRVTDYQKRMDTLQEMKPGEEKRDYLHETRAILKKHMFLLEHGFMYLQKAETMESELNNSDRKAKIESNKQFIRWVQAFTEEASS
jgi:hypothetical protein